MNTKKTNSDVSAEVVEALIKAKEAAPILGKTESDNLPTEATQLQFSLEEAKYLYGIVALMYQRSQAAKDDFNTYAWGIIGHKVYNKQSVYSRTEVQLLTLSVEGALTAGKTAYDKMTDLAARLRAQALTTAFEAIKRKLENAEWKNVRFRERTGNVQGQNEGPNEGQVHPVPGAAGYPDAAGQGGGDAGQS